MYNQIVNYYNNRWLYVFLIITLSINLEFCGNRESNNEARQSPINPDSEKFRGKSLMVVAPGLAAGLISGPIIEYAKIFNGKTGAHVRVVTPGWRETAIQIEESIHNPNINYDIFVITTSWSGVVFKNKVAEPVPDSIKQLIEWNDILPIYREGILRWGDNYYALPYDGDVVTLFYRKDIFEDPLYKNAFKKEYGIALRVPDTWDDYNRIASFFSKQDRDGDGKTDPGIVGSRLKNSSSMLIFLSKAAAYAKYPDDPAFYFDIKTMEPRINSPAFVKALREYIEELDYGPPGMINYAASDTRSAFIRGEGVMVIDWANIGVLAETAPQSIIKEKVGYTQLPGANEVYNVRKKRWEKKYNRVSSLVGNYIFIVNRKSKNKDLAFAFASYMTSPEITGRLVSKAGAGINPSRFSHLKNPASWREGGFSEDSASRYIQTIKQAIHTENFILDIRIPGSAEYYASLDEYLYRALKKELSPQMALDEVSKRWNDITDTYGRVNQAELYRMSVNEADSSN